MTSRKLTIPTDLPRGVLLDAAGEFVLPSDMAVCSDLLYTTREARLAKQREADKLEALEKALKKHFVENLAKSSSGVAGRIALTRIILNPIPVVENWDSFYAFVRRTNSFDLLQRRLAETAVKERLDAKKKLPGVTIFQDKKVSVTRL
jgi:hypothetical protein